MIYLFGVKKGGAGKSTLATNLAAMRAAAGRDVLLVDCDTQASAARWCAIRGEQGAEDGLPQLTCVSKFGTQVSKDLTALRSKFDDIIVDAGGRDSPELRSAMIVADRMVMPVRPSQFDTWVLGAMTELLTDVHAIGNEIVPLLVINAASSNPAVRETEELAQSLSQYDQFQVCPVAICDRMAYRRAIIEGKGVFEAKNKDAKAVAEMVALYKEVFGENFRPRSNKA